MATREQLLAEIARRQAIAPPVAAAVSAPVTPQAAPAGVSMEQVRAEIQRRQQPAQPQQPVQQSEGFQQGVQQLAQETGLPEALIVSIGRGFIKVGRGAQRLAARATGDEKKLQEIAAREAEDIAIFEPLQEARPVTTFAGELIGEAAPFAPLGLAAGAGRGLAGRAIGTGLATAAESAVLAPEDTAQAAGIGGAIGITTELLAPRLGKVFRRLTGKVLKGSPVDATGNLSTSFANELEKAGISIEDISEGVKESIAKTLDPELDAAAGFRQARAQEFGLDLSQAQAAKDFAAQEAESVLLGSPTPAGEAGRRLQAERLEQAAVGAREKVLRPLMSSIDLDFEQKGSQFTKRELGNVLKSSIDELRSRDQEVINGLYKAARELPGADIPLDKETTKDLFLSAIDEIEPDETTLKSIKKTLAKFGVIGEKPVKKGTSTIVDFEGEKISFLGDVEDFSINNSEDIRKRLNRAFQGDRTGLISALKRQIDANVGDVVDEAVEAAPGERAGAFQAARQAFSDFKADFEAGDIIQNLVSVKRGTDVPKIAEEEVFNKIFRSSRKIENIKRLKRLLTKNPTANSRQALTDLGAVAVEDLLKDAVNPQTGVLSGRRLTTAVNKLGEDTLRILLAPDQFKQLKSFQGALGDLTIPLEGTQNLSGSGQRVLNAVTRLMDIKAPGVGRIVKRSTEKESSRKILDEGLKSLKGVRGQSAIQQRAAIAGRTLLALTAAREAANGETR